MARTEQWPPLPLGGGSALTPAGIVPRPFYRFSAVRGSPYVSAATGSTSGSNLYDPQRRVGRRPVAQRSMLSGLSWGQAGSPQANPKDGGDDPRHLTPLEAGRLPRAIPTRLLHEPPRRVGRRPVALRSMLSGLLLLLLLPDGPRVWVPRY